MEADDERDSDEDLTRANVSMKHPQDDIDMANDDNGQSTDVHEVAEEELEEEEEVLLLPICLMDGGTGSDSGADSDDPTGLEGAAFQSRMPFNDMTKAEQDAFADVATGSRQTRKVFLFLRNRLLEMWLEEPLRQLTLSDAQEALCREPALSSDENSRLLKRVLTYLERRGLVNFGVFRVSRLVFYRWSIWTCMIVFSRFRSISKSL